jgi:excisionase family DNA binding protein
MKWFKNDNAKLVPIAEEMFVVRGMSGREVAEALNVHESTIYRWADKGKWKEKRRLHEDTLRNTLISLEAKLQELGNEIKDLSIHDQNFTKKTDGLSKLVAQIVKLRRFHDQDILKITVMVMSRFSLYVAKQNLDEHTLQVLENLVDEFFDQTKKEYQP